MHLLFVDNSYVENDEYNLTSIGGFIIRDSDYLALRQGFADIKVAHGLLPLDPVKWSPGQTDRRFARQRAIADQNALKRDVLELVGQSNLTIVSAFIVDPFTRPVVQRQRITRAEKQAIKLGYEKQAIEYLSQRLQMELQDINRANGERNKGLFILECPDTEKAPLLIEHYKKIWHNGTRGTFSMRLNLLFDGLTYSHDFGYDGIQLADFIIGSMCFSIKNSRYHYLDLYKDKIRQRGGKVKGFGIVVYPSNSNRINNFITRIEA